MVSKSKIVSYWQLSIIAVLAVCSPSLWALDAGDAGDAGVAGKIAKSSLRVVRFFDTASIEIEFHNRKTTLRPGDRADSWTLMAVVAANGSDAKPYAIFEDFSRLDGMMLIVAADEQIALTKTAEASFAENKSLLLGHSQAEIIQSSTDLLGREILARSGDPQFDAIASVFAPITRVKSNTFSFTGNPDTIDKMGYSYGGRTANFDPAVLHPGIKKIADAGKVRHGLVGGFLPILRFVYPDMEGNAWTEMIAFSPLHIANNNFRIQPVWYRVSRIENGLLTWSRYIDSYQSFSPRASTNVGDGAQWFYADLVGLRTGWNQILRQAMQIEVPDKRVANMARFSLVRAIMTRVGDFPKYGVVDKDYGGSEHDGFPDTFNVETTAMLEWGLIDRAGRYIENYLSQFVRDDGSILYRGPETGQYGRMLTVLTQYVDNGGDPQLLVKLRRKIDGITNLLLSMRSKALNVASSDAAYGMLAGWSEADSCLEADPQRYVQPYFSNSTEAARGFENLGRVWQAIGNKTANVELTAWGERLAVAGASLRKDVQTAISRSLLLVDGGKVLPAIAGVAQPFHIAVERDKDDPQFRSYRAYMEMMYSGNLTRDQVGMIVDYRSNHHDIILGMPTAYAKAELAGFLSYGYGYGLIQHDRVREALLMMYSDMAHQYTRGMWMAPETRIPFTDSEAAPYASPSQLVVSLMTRWLLVFEDPEANEVWLAKAVPRDWLRDGEKIVVDGAPTKWGRIGYTIESHLKSRTIAAQVHFPSGLFGAETHLRLRVPSNAKLKSVTLNDKSWKQFDATREVITLPRGMRGDANVIAYY